MQQRSAVLALVSAAAVLCVVGWSRSGRSVVVLQSTTGREQELNALDDYRAERAGGRFGRSFGSVVQRNAYDAVSRDHAINPHKHDSSATSYINSKFPKKIMDREYLNTIDSLNKASEHEEESPIHFARRARTTGLQEQMAIPLGELPNTPKKPSLQPKLTYAAADPFGGKALLKADPKHPGFVMLTEHALRRKAAYDAWLKEHPYDFTGTSTLANLDASSDPPATPHHDSGRYKLSQLGVRV